MDLQPAHGPDHVVFLGARRKEQQLHVVRHLAGQRARQLEQDRHRAGVVHAARRVVAVLQRRERQQRHGRRTAQRRGEPGRARQRAAQHGGHEQSQQAQRSQDRQQREPHAERKGQVLRLAVVVRHEDQAEPRPRTTTVTRHVVSPRRPRFGVEPLGAGRPDQQYTADEQGHQHQCQRRRHRLTGGRAARADEHRGRDQDESDRAEGQADVIGELLAVDLESRVAELARHDRGGLPVAFASRVARKGDLVRIAQQPGAGVVAHRQLKLAHRTPMSAPQPGRAACDPRSESADPTRPASAPRARRGVRRSA